MSSDARHSSALKLDESPLSAERPICVAILALGGEGGGVLADWLVDLAERNGYAAQATSVPGVAQRTGATIYYLEFFKDSVAREAGKEPVLALMPVPGQVDIVVASELMEAARAVDRGLVTPDLTTLITSTSRTYAMTEKLSLGDGRADSQAMLQACKVAAKRTVMADMKQIADRHGAVISAALLGAIAGSGKLPFSRAMFEDAIRARGVGVETSLAAFDAAYDAAAGGGSEHEPPKDSFRRLSCEPKPSKSAIAELIAREFPVQAHEILYEGARLLAEYQDVQHAAAYLTRLCEIRELDGRHGDGSWRLLVNTARYLALWMSYEDAIRVADLKIRASRFMRVREEVRADHGQILRFHEFMHPRIEEIADVLPAPVGRRLLRPGLINGVLRRLTAKGRRVETSSLSGFLMLWLIASLRPIRRRSLRFGVENDRIRAWLETVAAIVPQDYSFAVEAAECPRLIKGYGETHERGLRNFEKLMAAAQFIEKSPNGAERFRDLRETALTDERLANFDEALKAV